MRDYFTDRLDNEVRGSLSRAFGPPVDFRGPGSRGDDRGPRGQSIGTLTAVLDSTSGTTRSTGSVLQDASRGGTTEEALSAAVLARLEDLPTDGVVREVSLPGLGAYRLVAAGESGVTAVAGLPTDEVDEALAWLLTIVLVVSAAAVAVAGGAGTVVVRRQLAPLREVAGTAHRVAELPLASGEIEMTERVPERFTDERTEIGQVGAALNAMLDHVESSLDQRHRSEQQVRQFVADASHELRTPLATIAGYTELARRRPETTRHRPRQGRDRVGRMTGLVEDLLLLAGLFCTTTARRRSRLRHLSPPAPRGG